MITTPHIHLVGLFSLLFTGICNRPQRGLKSSSEGMDSEVAAPGWENTSLDSSLEPAALAVRLDGDELLDHLRLSILPWDESILDTLSPELATGTPSSGWARAAPCFLSCVLWRKMVLPHGSDRARRPGQAAGNISFHVYSLVCCYHSQHSPPILAPC